MTARRFRAPGKLVVLGEYAVLDESPCLVAALEHGVECALTDTAQQRRIITPYDDRFVAACLDNLKIDTGTWRFSDWNPLLLDGKPGFGGSAAASVVATLAGSMYLNSSVTRDHIFQQAAATHHRVQGSGSGVDIAAAVYGGFLEFTAGAVSPRPPLPVVAVWSGRSAQTGPRVEAYLRWAGRRAFAAEMESLVRGFYSAPIEATREGYQLLCKMSIGAGISYQTDALSAIYELAIQYRGAAKPSGAGGGDCAVAIFSTPEQRRDFEGACTRSGFSVIPVSIADAAAELPSEKS